MATNETEKSSPKVSKLPLPISDSPLVIDLPDGQKIVVGKMVQGSVIEVATWRGVGRPDSRTSRLMLGMGSGNVNEDSEGGDQSSQSQGSTQGSASRAPQKPAGIAGYIFTLQHFIKNFNRINWSATIKALFASLTSKKAKGPKKVKPAKGASVDATTTSDAGITPTVTISRASEDADIEAWLNKITEKATRDTAKNSGKSAPKSKAPAKKAPAKSSKTRSGKK